LETHESHCPACHSQRIDSRWKAHRLPGAKEVAWCGECGFGWLQPFPTKDEVHDYYYDTDALSYVIQNDSEKRKGFEQRLKRLSQLMPERGTLLDVGSGLGHFLSMAQEDGWNVDGVELQKSAAEYCQERYGIQPHVGYIEALNLAPNSFDVVTMWDVLEHVHNPVEFLRSCALLVKPGGILVLAIPNASGWPARIFKGGWRYVMTHHLSYFTMDRINRMLDDIHLSIVATNHTIKVQSLAHGLESLLPGIVDSERLMRVGRENAIEHADWDQRENSSRLGDLKHATLKRVRQLMFSINMTSLKWPIGDLMDIYCRKGDGH